MPDGRLTPEQPSIESDLTLLLNAGRVSPILRDAVWRVEVYVNALRDTEAALRADLAAANSARIGAVANEKQWCDQALAAEKALAVAEQERDEWKDRVMGAEHNEGMVVTDYQYEKTHNQILAERVRLLEGALTEDAVTVYVTFYSARTDIDGYESLGPACCPEFVLHEGVPVSLAGAAPRYLSVRVARAAPADREQT